MGMVFFAGNFIVWYPIHTNIEQWKRFHRKLERRAFIIKNISSFNLKLEKISDAIIVVVTSCMNFKKKGEGGCPIENLFLMTFCGNRF